MQSQQQHLNNQQSNDCQLSMPRRNGKSKMMELVQSHIKREIASSNAQANREIKHLQDVLASRNKRLQQLECENRKVKIGAILTFIFATISVIAAMWGGL